ncbi:MAG: thioredoxin [Pseudomonadota bacterium]
MQHLTIEMFKEKIYDFDNNKTWQFKGALPVIIDFYADWCGPCQSLSPILEDLSQEYAGKVDFYKVDTEQEEALSAMFNIRSIPSMLFIPLGEEPQMAAGALSKSALKEAILKVLKVT